MKIIIKILKLFASVVALLSIAIAGYLAYENYQSNKKKEAELSFYTSKEMQWRWHDENNGIQIRSTDRGVSILRKVNIEDNFIVSVTKNDNYELLALAIFTTKCKPNTVITTSQIFEDGKPKTLECNEEGDALTYGAKWSGKDTDLVWNEDMDGFKVYVNFGDWDFTKLDQEITLSKAKQKPAVTSNTPPH